MRYRLRRSHFLPVLFWVLAFACIPFLASIQRPAPGWDLRVYGHAVQAVEEKQDPYARGIAAQRIFHGQLQLHPDDLPPFTYVYSPITLPILRALGTVPQAIAGKVYWVMFAMGLVAMVMATLFAAQPEERYILSLMAPAAAFFPGLLETKAFFSGNLVYILYGVVLSAAVLGWRYDRWKWSYAATLVASCFKAPLLSLLLIAPLSARKQWSRMCLVAVAGSTLFVVQPLIWPTVFHNYLEAVSLQFSYNHDFGFSPAGLLGDALFSFGLPYSTASSIFYLAYAALVFFTLLKLSRRFLMGSFSLARWIPVMLLGVVLLNPRIKEYDVAPLSLLMLMVLWRAFSHARTPALKVLGTASSLVAFNLIGATSDVMWKPVAGVLLVGLFVLGARELFEGSATSSKSFAARDLMPEGLR